MYPVANLQPKLENNLCEIVQKQKGILMLEILKRIYASLYKAALAPLSLTEWQQSFQTYMSCSQAESKR